MLDYTARSIGKYMTHTLSTELKKLIHILSDGQYHTIESLARSLQLKPAELDKLLAQLATWDIELQKNTQQQYAIPGGLELLSLSNLSQSLTAAGQSFHPQLVIFDTLASTNDYLLQHALPAKVQICLAEKQTAGKGRRGRVWQSPYGKNIYLSIGWRFTQTVSCLSLAIGVAVIETLSQYGIQQDIAMKWPNDIYWQGRKLAGILIELGSEISNQAYAVVGVGINLALASSASELIEQAWVDIATITHSKPQRNKLVGILLQRLLTALSLFEQQGFAPFANAWQKYDATLGKNVSVIMPTTTITGIGRGIDAQGYFLLENAQGQIQRFSSGEVSIRL
jgi:BirA family biotin operon repressor/biotin-[acetyl-CoA-carboxylase] ligase